MSHPTSSLTESRDLVPLRLNSCGVILLLLKHLGPRLGCWGSRCSSFSSPYSCCEPERWQLAWGNSWQLHCSFSPLISAASAWKAEGLTLVKEKFVIGYLSGCVFSEQKKDFINKVKMSLECSHIFLSLFQTPGRRYLVVLGGESPDFHVDPGGVFVLPQYVHFLLFKELGQHFP